MTEKRKYVIISLLCVAGFAVNISAYMPGFMSPDSFDQYRQSITHQYNDWHPPVMAFVWSLLNNIYQGPQVMLCFQLAMLWTACYFFSSAISSKVWQAVILMVFGLSPFFQNFAGYIIKDTQMAFSWLLTIALLFHFVTQNKQVNIFVSIVSLLLLLYGALLRPNAITGYMPLVILWVWLVFHKYKFLTKSFAVISIFLLTVTVQKGIPYLLNAEKQYAENKLFLHDLTGIYKNTGDNVFPQVLFQQKQFDTTYLSQKYHTATFDDIWWNPDGVLLLPDTNEVVTNEIKTAWLKAIKTHPDVYLKNRADGFLYYLRIKQRSDFYCNYYTYMYPDPNEYGFTPKYENFFYRIYHEMFVAQKGLFYMKAWFWLLVNTLLLVFIPVFKDKQVRLIYACIILSGVLYKMPDLFIYQSDTDYRYFYWNTIICCIGLVMLIMKRKIEFVK